MINPILTTSIDDFAWQFAPAEPGCAASDFAGMVDSSLAASDGSANVVANPGMIICWSAPLEPAPAETKIPNTTGTKPIPVETAFEFTTSTIFSTDKKPMPIQPNFQQDWLDVNQKAPTEVLDEPQVCKFAEIFLPKGLRPHAAKPISAAGVDDVFDIEISVLPKGFEKLLNSPLKKERLTDTDKQIVSVSETAETDITSICGPTDLPLGTVIPIVEAKTSVDAKYDKAELELASPGTVKFVEASFPSPKSDLSSTSEKSFLINEREGWEIAKKAEIYKPEVQFSAGSENGANSIPATTTVTTTQSPKIEIQQISPSDDGSRLIGENQLAADGLSNLAKQKESAKFNGEKAVQSDFFDADAFKFESNREGNGRSLDFFESKPPIQIQFARHPMFESGLHIRKSPAALRSIFSDAENPAEPVSILPVEQEYSKQPATVPESGIAAMQPLLTESPATVSNDFSKPPGKKLPFDGEIVGVPDGEQNAALISKESDLVERVKIIRGVENRESDGGAEALGKIEAGSTASNQAFENLFQGISSRHENGLKSPAKLAASDQILSQLEPQFLQLANVAKMGDGKKVIKIKLHPEELGEVEITLEKSSAGKINAHFQSDNETTRQTLRDGLVQLRASLENSGSNVGDLLISNRSSSSNGGGDSNRHAQQAQTQPEYGISHQEIDENIPHDDNLQDRLLNLRA